MSDELVFNGVNGATGDYLLPKLSVEDVAKVALGQPLDDEELAHRRALQARKRQENAEHLAVKEGIDAEKLDQAGWGVVFAREDERTDEILEALQPLLELRQGQAGERYRVFAGDDGYKKGEFKRRFLARHGMGNGPVDPDKVPYYLLLVGSPDEMPFQFQHQLDVQYAPGRLHFDTLDEYAAYAENVVAAESGRRQRSKNAVFFGVRNGGGDKATQLSSRNLVQPLAEKLAADKADWAISTRLADECKKADLAAVLADPEKPAFLFTASHGIGFPNGDPRQLPHQGALLCQDWPGPLRWIDQPIPPEHYFAADDLEGVDTLGGLIAFHFACYGAGTPQMDAFFHRDGVREQIAPHPFVARLPQQMLSQPGGGALAVIGHVERAWGSSFLTAGAGAQIETFRSTLKRLLDGHPVGYAMDYFGSRYATISTGLTELLEIAEFGEVSPGDLASLWTANNDARAYTILGDPAVRLAI